MSFRETIQHHKGILIAAFACLAAVTVSAMLSMSRPTANATSPTLQTRAWFTTDDGKTWFADDAKKLPPFVKDGKEASRAYVFRAASGTEFVGYLERYTPTGKQMAESHGSAPPNQDLIEPTRAYGSMMQVKKPGQPTWVASDGFQAPSIRRASSPKGETQNLEPVYPQ